MKPTSLDERSESNGVLVEPPPRDRQIAATRAAFEAVGVDAPDDEHVHALVDGVTADSLHELCRSYDLDPEAFWTPREEHDERVQLEDFRSGARGSYDDVAAIADCSTRLGVVSNNHHSTIEFVLEHFELGEHVDAYYGREMSIESLERKKPAPHLLERALADLDADDALFVGDSESDVVAADRAGVDSAFLRRAHCADATLSTTPTHEVADLREVARIASA